MRLSVLNLLVLGGLAGLSVTWLLRDQHALALVSFGALVVFTWHLLAELR